MKHKLFGKLALSAALLSVAAVPVHAAGNDAVSTAPSLNIEGVQAISTTIGHFQSPLELAEKYAPDTVKDWKEALKKYDELAGTEDGLHFAETQPVVRIHDLAGVALPEGEFAESITLEISAADVKDFKDWKETKNLNGVKAIKGDTFFSVAKINDAVASAKDGAFTAVQPVKASADSVQYELLEGKEVSLSAVAISDESRSFIHARMDLFKAVESKDSDAIKEALANLLDEYKKQIVQLETESGE
ncbi:hypothetical protein JCM10914A_24110 [Paenibacillus sp. JCM 10914]|uniref:hypothetical protein n=1 Tax=Paenibacillus sp. JCM 10914 TaxID=1236974 RepID=UPI0003CC5A71|nr:hypothetical protein [Paenibacillus sp. JCM 10914]GAE06084.1 hypothetical protein JCM10914_2224 [Paenibacillus sp. JCM 10914]